MPQELAVTKLDLSADVGQSVYSADLVIDGEWEFDFGIDNQVAFEELASLSEREQDARLMAAAEHMACLDVGFVDPDHLRLYAGDRKRNVQTRAESAAKDDPETRRRLFVEQALERAFAINNRQLYEYLVDTFAGGHKLSTTTLPVRDARELLYAAHAIEVGAAGWGNGGFRFEVRETGPCYVR